MGDADHLTERLSGDIIRSAMDALFLLATWADSQAEAAVRNLVERADVTVKSVEGPAVFAKVKQRLKSADLPDGVRCVFYDRLSDIEIDHLEPAAKHAARLWNRIVERAHAAPAPRHREGARWDAFGPAAAPDLSFDH